MLRPVCLYGAEIWAMGLAKYKGKFDLQTKFDDYLLAEKLLLSYGRVTLGVKRNTSNAAVRGELGLYPLYINAICQAVKYLEHITKSDCNSLLYNSFVELFSADYGWIYELKNILLKLNYTWDTEIMLDHETINN